MSFKINILKKIQQFSLMFTGVICLSGPLYAADNYSDELAASWETLEIYCMDCHNFQDYSGGVDFTLFDPDDVTVEAEIFERAITKLRANVMPPPSQPQPDETTRWQLISSLENTLDEHAASNAHPGRVGLRRLNRSEYINAIYELTGVELAADVLPQDDVSDGFDNIVNVLKISPAFLDQFISAARLVSEEAIGSPQPLIETSTYAMDTSNQTSHIHGLPLGTRGGVLLEHVFPVDGEYAFGIEGMFTRLYHIGLENEETLIMTIDGVEVFRANIGGVEDLKYIDQQQAPAIAEINARFSDIRLPVSSGKHIIGMAFLAHSFAEADDPLRNTGENIGVSRITRAQTLSIQGPYDSNGLINTPSRNKIMACEPETPAGELDCARQIFTNLTTEAFRYPVSNADLEVPMRFFAEARERGNFDEGIKNGMVSILTSPKFLFRSEVPPANVQAGESFELSDLELASRLAFFLWSSPPDAQLISLAAADVLSQSENLDAEINRMLADPRAETLIENFAFQWLELRALNEANPDGEIFPKYDPGLRDDLIQEVNLFIGSIMREDRSVLTLLSADYSYLNERLALHYDIADIRGDQFRRVTLADEERYGLLGKGAVLMVTSYANRTSPVLRGAYIMENLIGVEPASPPPNVEAFPETPEGSAVALTVRQRLESHRANPSCASCHNVMDPLGLALENFDAIGAWRERDSDAGNAIIDASGQLAGGETINGVNDLRNALLSSPEQFAQVFTKKLMTYALGRTVEYHDMPTVRAVVRAAASDNYKFSAIVKGLINSEQFMLSVAPELELTTAAN
ncbi:DUF1592 domain-containing protein [Haliea sp. AH-315-K21]|nr:DUF1592 domain-containing protein [Haliea sp. AH-315-K21]